MKGIAAILVIMLAIIGGIVWYFLQPAQIPDEEITSFVDACIQESNSFTKFMQAARSNDPALCTHQTGVMMKLCMAHITQDSKVCDSAEPDIKQACLALAAGDKEQCPADDPLCKALLGNLQACREMNLRRFACEEALLGNTEYAGSAKMEEDCKQLAAYTIALDSTNKHNCRKISNQILREECMSILKAS